MAINAVGAMLRAAIEATPELNGRFTNLTLMNVDPVSGAQRGCFSLVFKAHDKLENKDVAVKFFDPASAMDAYRLTAFKREHEILQCLAGSDRCLQLVAPIAKYELTLDLGGGQSTVFPCEYFVMDWIDEEIDAYFLTQDHSALEKLKLFNDMVLAVEALHSHKVFHRDLKADNMRAMQKALRRVVIAIDLGTAARLDSGLLEPQYVNPVGAPAYSSPEAICGLSGNRRVAEYSDYYALGCLLFELFNPDYFYRATRLLNTNIDARFTAMGLGLYAIKDQEAQQESWHRSLTKLGSGIQKVSICAPGSCAPKAISNMLDEILAALTSVDYRVRRNSKSWIRPKLQTAIKVLGNEVAYQRRLAANRALRRRREAAALDRAAKLAMYQQRQQRIGGENGNV